jgi:NADPH:quinone reductase-like Zn-dependent oxidoreductase
MGSAGEVVEAGSDCTLFKKGDTVYYAGSISRPLGTNCEFHLVDERIVGRKPKSLSFEEAAAMPLTTITAWRLDMIDYLCTRILSEGEPRVPHSRQIIIIDHMMYHHIFLL